MNIYEKIRQVIFRKKFTGSKNGMDKREIHWKIKKKKHIKIEIGANEARGHENWKLVGTNFT